MCCYCDCICCDCILAILAFVLPPLPVAIKKGLCSCDVLINICLCLLGFVPGLIHAWYVILKNPDRMLIDDEERQIFIVSPQGTPQVLVTQQPNQTQIRFQHPEPFLENRLSTRHIVHSPRSQISPFSSPPNADVITSSTTLNQQHLSYGSTGPNISPEDEGENDNDNPDEAPPSYENVMNETAKQFH